jgi:hypothetical protein
VAAQVLVAAPAPVVARVWVAAQALVATQVLLAAQAQALVKAHVKGVTLVWSLEMSQGTSYLVKEAMVLMTMVLMLTVGMATAVMTTAVMAKAMAGKKMDMANGADLAKAHRKEGRGGVHHPLLLHRSSTSHRHLAAFLVRLACGKASEGEAGGGFLGREDGGGWLLRLRSVQLLLCRRRQRRRLGILAVGKVFSTRQQVMKTSFWAAVLMECTRKDPQQCSAYIAT